MNGQEKVRDLDARFKMKLIDVARLTDGVYLFMEKNSPKILEFGRVTVNGTGTVVFITGIAEGYVTQLRIKDLTGMDIYRIKELSILNLVVGENES